MKQLYLGTRYTGLLAFICLFVIMDSPGHDILCQVRLQVWQFYSSGEIIFDTHIFTAIHDSRLCESTAPITSSLLVE